MAKRISDIDRMFQYYMAQPVANVEQVHMMLGALLKQRQPKPEARPRKARKSKHVSEVLPGQG